MSKTLQLVIHALALLAGVLSIVAANAATLGISPGIASVIGVLIVVVIYLSNQLPNLGAGTAPTAPVAPPVTNHSPITTVPPQ